MKGKSWKFQNFPEIMEMIYLFFSKQNYGMKTSSKHWKK